MKILAADIGGTNSRFALFKDSGNEIVLEDSIWLESRGVDSFEQLMETLWASDFPAKPGEIASGVIAVPGAVQDGVVCKKAPNLPWNIDLRGRDTGVGKLLMINDFEAQAYACLTPAVDDALVIQEGEEADGPIAVVGPGTGLGHAGIFPSPFGMMVLASEGGHMGFPFVGSEEARYEEFLRAETGRPFIDGDVVVTGGGLKHLHKFLTGDVMTPETIADTFDENSVTMAWFARFMGRVCRNWTIALVSAGGLFITGGVAMRNPELLSHPEFLAELHNSPEYEPFMRSIPVRLNRNDQSGLFGAAYVAGAMMETA